MIWILLIPIILFIFYINKIYQRSYYKINKKYCVIYYLVSLGLYFFILKINSMIGIDYENSLFLTSLKVSFVEETLKIIAVLIGVIITRKCMREYLKSRRDLFYIVFNMILLFGTLESLLYFSMFNNYVVFIVRMFTSVPLHLVCTLIFAIALYDLKLKYIPLSYFLHFIYNFLLNGDLNKIFLVIFLNIIYAIVLYYIYVFYKDIKEKEGYFYKLQRSYEFFNKISNKRF